jgi:hypothetical protein
LLLLQLRLSMVGEALLTQHLLLLLLVRMVVLLLLLG